MEIFGIDKLIKPESDPDRIDVALRKEKQETADYVAEILEEEENRDQIIRDNAESESENTCECCDNVTTNLAIYNTMKMCPECLENELALETESEASADQRVTEVRELTIEQLVKPVDTTIAVDTDIFNANTPSIIQMKAIIAADDSIDEKNKAFELYQQLDKIWHELQAAIFNRNKENVRDTSIQRSIQQFQNDQILKLREDERAKIKARDVNYKPIVPKVSKPRKPKARKFDKKEIIRVSKELNLPEWTLQTTCVQTNLAPELAAKYLLGMKSGESNLPELLKELQIEDKQ